MEDSSTCPAPPPTNAEAERILIRDITVAAEPQMKEGDSFFLVSNRWWQRWLDYVNQDAVSTTNNGSSPYGSHYYESGCSSTPLRPLAIDNSDLIYDATCEVSNTEIELHDTLVEGRDYILLPQQVWEKLHGWYGGGPTLARKAINSGYSQTDLAIEVYPLRLQLLLISKGERAIARISKKETVGDLHRKACEVFDLMSDHVSIWDYYGHKKHALMDDLEKTLDDANIQMDQDGELALAFGELLRRLWAPGRGSVSPKPFKNKLARFAPQFSGYSQHDSQELLAFLLDGLHEDLNRVKHRPYVNSRDADGRPDEEVADEYWANHIARNDSIIVDVCQGQYKSTLICPVCDKVSVTFDPFMYLSLPLQSPSARTMSVLVFTCDGSALPTTCTVTVPKQGRLKELVQALSTSSSLKNEEKLMVAEIHNHSISQILEDPCFLLSTIKDDDHLAAYKLPKVAKSSVTLQFVHRREEVELGSTRRTKAWKPFGTPFLASISCNESIRRDDLQGIIHKMLNPMLHPEERQPLGANQATSTSEATVSANSDIQDQEQDIITSVDAAEHQFQLFDENGKCIDILAGEDKVIRLPSSSRPMFINWSEEDLKKYDTHCMENLPEVHKYASAPKRARTEPLSLYACLDAFLREEPLVPEDMWYCPRCKEQRQASKKLDLWRLPEVLVIHLKRFSFSRSTKHKLETFVNFPIHDFDLTNYVARKGSPQRQLYELYALSNHYGGMGSGHYTAFIKLPDENKWYNFDDSHIYPMAEEDVKSTAAYVLFYRRVRGETYTSNGTGHV